MSAPPTLRRRWRGKLVGVIAPIVAHSVALLGWRGAQQLGAAAGSLAWRLSGRQRARTREHLGIAFPELTVAAREELGRRCFRHLGAMGGETMVLLARGPKVLGTRLGIEGEQHLEQALSGGRPVVLLMGHCGNWELVGAVLGLLGIETWAIVREMQAPEVEALVANFRAKMGGIRSIPRGSAAASRALLAVLRQPRATLALLVDQDFEAEGVMVPFFGRLAHTPVGPARLALRRGCVVVPVFDQRLDDGTHRVTFQPALDLPADETEATAVMTMTIEAQIRRVPEQWVWMHRRWRRGLQEPEPRS